MVPTAGGAATQLTRHPAKDEQPVFSPDGKRIAFISDRKDGNQVWVMPADGSAPKQVTFHTAGYTLHGWFPGGTHLLASGRRDHSWNRAAARFLKINVDRRAAEELIFDDHGSDGSISPDGSKLLFVREGVAWWRKGYVGSQAGQIWQYDLAAKSFTKLIDDPAGAMAPRWMPDGTGFWYVSGKAASWNLTEYRFATKQSKPLTFFKDDGVAFPAFSADGSTVVYRNLFDLFVTTPGDAGQSRKLEITATGDVELTREQRRALNSATEVSFTRDGLQIAFTAGGDLWVMDTELREPIQVTKTPDEERSPEFAPDGKSLWFVSDSGGDPDIWKAERNDADKYWWQNEGFKLTQVTKDDLAETGLSFSADGGRLAFNKGLGDLVVMEVKDGSTKTISKSFQPSRFVWAPDGKWLAWVQPDDDFNYDVWLAPVDGSKPAYNVSRHPDVDSDPAWSPDGKLLAWVGRRGENSEADVYYVWLDRKERDRTGRERAMEKAIEKMKKGPSAATKAAAPAGGATGAPGVNPAAPGTPAPGSPAPGPGTPIRRRRGGEEFATAGVGGDAELEQEPNRDPTAKQAVNEPPKASKAGKAEEPKTAGKAESGVAKKAGDSPVSPTAKKPVVVSIDFERLHERAQRIAIPNSTEGTLVFSPDSRKLAFAATVNGVRGTYTVEFPDGLRPTLLGPTVISSPVWLEQGNQIVGLSAGTPSAMVGAVTNNYRVSAVQTLDLADKSRAVFDACWRAMRDNWYDDRYGNRDWKAIRTKYRGEALASWDPDSLQQLVQMMLGELNGSHLGFTMGRALPTGPEPPATPTEPTEPVTTIQTVHLGVRFDPSFAGPGLRIRDVITGGPADRAQSKLVAGEIVLSINGKEVAPKTDPTLALNLPRSAGVQLKVKDAAGKERTVSIEPTTFTAVRTLLYEKWMADNRALVDRLSGGKLGYLHIEAMGMPSFYRYEQELHSAGYGKEGLVIDVRENGGGSTADLLLTSLTQPKHAIAVPRGGGQGYPQDRLVFAAWQKPIIVLCNQNSFSNAEIFSHAIKTLKRGKVVGVPTAGGVISTGAKGIMDVGMIRTPFRGWYLVNDGEDLELNGAVPDVIVWPEPGDAAAGRDRQIEKAVELLTADCAAEKAKPRPKLIKATERKAPAAGATAR
jgi:Tol biopolymer transport system component